MAANAEVNVKISSEFRNILLELVVAYLIEQPPDFLDFAIEFLKKKKEEKVGKRPPARLMESHESEASMGSAYHEGRERRGTVFAERYDPEEEADYRAPIYKKGKNEKMRMMDNLKNILMFRSLESTEKEELLDAMMKREVFEGEELIKQGEEGDFFYVVESGSYEAWLDGRILLKKYVNSGSFGELALMYNVPRACSVKAISDGVVWTLDRQTFRKIVVTNAFKRRKMYEMFIEGVPLLNALNDFERMSLADALVTQNFESGQKIIAQGDIADGMYFIEKGTVKITIKAKDGSELDMKQLRAGEYFGELALLTSKPRAASAWAESDVRLAFLDVDTFERLLGPCMDIMKRNVDIYEQQLNQLFGKAVIDPRDIRK